MLVAILHIEIELPFVNGLKERRKYLNSIKERLKRYNLSILDISKEHPKEAEFAVSFLAFTQEEANSKVNSIDKIFQTYYPELTIDIDIEFL
jgi:uncharacterized protein YlxP (DUF503 family)